MNLSKTIQKTLVNKFKRPTYKEGRHVENQLKFRKQIKLFYKEMISNLNCLSASTFTVFSACSRLVDVLCFSEPDRPK